MSPHLHLLLLLASPLLCAPSISKSYHQKSDLHNNVSQRAATCAGTWPPPATSCATAAPGTTPASTSRQGTTTAACRPRQTGHRRWAATFIVALTPGFQTYFSWKCVNGSLATFGHTVCKTGTPTKMSEVCNGRCFNEYQSDKVLGDRAHFRLVLWTINRWNCTITEKEGPSHKGWVGWWLV